MRETERQTYTASDYGGLPRGSSFFPLIKVLHDQTKKRHPACVTLGLLSHESDANYGHVRGARVPVFQMKAGPPSEHPRLRKGGRARGEQ